MSLTNNLSIHNGCKSLWGIVNKCMSVCLSSRISDVMTKKIKKINYVGKGSVFFGASIFSNWQRQKAKQLSNGQSKISKLAKRKKAKISTKPPKGVARKVSGASSPMRRPPRSCDLTYLDFFLWSFVKSLSYADKPATIVDLENNIVRDIAEIQPYKI